MKFIHIKYFFFLVSLVIFLSCSTSTKQTKVDSIKTDNMKISDLMQKAQTFFQYNEFSNAIKIYKKILNKYSKNKNDYENYLAWANYEIGFSYLVLKKYKLAIKYFQIVIENYSIQAAMKLSKDRIKEINLKLFKKKL